MSNEQNISILVVEDDAPQRKILAGFLEKKGYAVVTADSAANAILASTKQEFDLLLTDLRLGGPDGISLLSTLREKHQDLQAIILTAYGTIEDATTAMRAGAYDFVSKPVDLSRLETLIGKALEVVALSKENRDLRTVVENSSAFSGMVGESQALQKVIRIAAKVAPSKTSVLILGESGTGKEVLARAIHLASPRRNKPFVTVNCAALPETLIESELFGHEAGAYTGAVGQKKGRFELADKGTVFMDEVGEIPLQVQVKLLNVLQSSSFERVGGTTTVNSDVRIIAATNRDMNKQILEGSFREDLFYRLNVVSINMPPLRNRSGDIPLFVKHLLTKHSNLSGTSIPSIRPEVIEMLKSYDFPGNVRELENLIERAVVLAEGNELTMEDFPEQLHLKNNDAKQSSSNWSSHVGLEAKIADLEISLIRSALEANNGNQSAAARDLHTTEPSIRYKMKKYGL